MDQNSNHHNPVIPAAQEKVVLQAQKGEITEHEIYKRLARMVKNKNNQEILLRVAEEEREHYDFWKGYTKQTIEPDGFKIFLYLIITRIFGTTFAIKLMEQREGVAQKIYQKLSKMMPEVADIVEDEQRHEQELIGLIDEERLRYVGSMVLGLNDALVELTGALAGLTLALQNTKLIALAGLITGIAASLSMAASEYLSIKTESGGRNPLKAALYTGSAYVLTVIFLIFPYLVFGNYLFCLSFTLFNALLVILLFTYYISVAQDTSFKNRFFEMALISLGVVGVSFLIGYLIRTVLRVEV